MTYWRNGLTIIILSLNYRNICYGLKGEYNVSSLQTVLRGDDTICLLIPCDYHCKILVIRKIATHIESFFHIFLLGKNSGLSKLRAINFDRLPFRAGLTYTSVTAPSLLCLALLFKVRFLSKRAYQLTVIKWDLKVYMFYTCFKW